MAQEEQPENPESMLIDVLAGQIQDDESLLEGLGSGTLSLGDLERWRQRRWEAEKRFLQDSGRLIAEMRRQGFGGMMRGSAVDPATRPRVGRAPGGKRRRARRALSQAAPRAPVAAEERRFSLDLADLGLPCSLHVRGTYEEVLDAGVWHARRAHRVAGGPASLRELVQSAIVEEQSTRLSPEQRLEGRRTEAQVSDETANRARGSGFASA